DLHSWPTTAAPRSTGNCASTGPPAAATCSRGSTPAHRETVRPADAPASWGTAVTWVRHPCAQTQSDPETGGSPVAVRAAAATPPAWADPLPGLAQARWVEV